MNRNERRRKVLLDRTAEGSAPGKGRRGRAARQGASRKAAPETAAPKSILKKSPAEQEAQYENKKSAVFEEASKVRQERAVEDRASREGPVAVGRNPRTRTFASPMRQARHNLREKEKRKPAGLREDYSEAGMGKPRTGPRDGGRQGRRSVRVVGTRPRGGRAGSTGSVKTGTPSPSSERVGREQPTRVDPQELQQIQQQRKEQDEDIMRKLQKLKEAQVLRREADQAAAEEAEQERIAAEEAAERIAAEEAAERIAAEEAAKRGGEKDDNRRRSKESIEQASIHLKEVREARAAAEKERQARVAAEKLAELERERSGAAFRAAKGMAEVVKIRKRAAAKARAEQERQEEVERQQIADEDARLMARIEEANESIAETDRELKISRADRLAAEIEAEKERRGLAQLADPRPTPEYIENLKAETMADAAAKVQAREEEMARVLAQVEAERARAEKAEQDHRSAIETLQAMRGDHKAYTSRVDSEAQAREAVWKEYQDEMESGLKMALEAQRLEEKRSLAEASAGASEAFDAGAEAGLASARMFLEETPYLYGDARRPRLTGIPQDSLFPEYETKLNQLSQKSSANDSKSDDDWKTGGQYRGTSRQREITQASEKSMDDLTSKHKHERSERPLIPETTGKSITKLLAAHAEAAKESDETLKRSEGRDVVLGAMAEGYSSEQLEASERKAATKKAVQEAVVRDQAAVKKIDDLSEQTRAQIAQTEALLRDRKMKGDVQKININKFLETEVTDKEQREGIFRRILTRRLTYAAPNKSLIAVNGDDKKLYKIYINQGTLMYKPYDYSNTGGSGVPVDDKKFYFVPTSIQVPVKTQESTEARVYTLYCCGIAKEEYSFNGELQIEEGFEIAPSDRDLGGSVTIYEGEYVQLESRDSIDEDSPNIEFRIYVSRREEDPISRITVKVTKDQLQNAIKGIQFHTKYYTKFKVKGNIEVLDDDQENSRPLLTSKLKFTDFDEDENGELYEKDYGEGDEDYGEIFGSAGNFLFLRRITDDDNFNLKILKVPLAETAYQTSIAGGGRKKKKSKRKKSSKHRKNQKRRKHTKKHKKTKNRSNRRSKRRSKRRSNLRSKRR